MSARRDYGSGSIVERSPGRWRVQVELGRDPRTGRRRRRYVTVEGAKRDAQRALRDLLTERDRGGAIVSASAPTADYLTDWLARYEQRRDLAESTRVRYREIVRGHLVPGLGQIKLQELRAPHIAAVFDEQRGRLSDGTLRQHRVVLNRALRDAVRSGLLALNPADAVEWVQARRPAERRALDEGEIRSLLGATTGTPLDPLVRFALASGLRIGELLALRWDDVDLQAGTVAVERTARFFAGRGVQFSATKTQKSRRTVELSPATARLIEAHRRAQLERRLLLGAAWRDQGLVFPSEIGTPWLARNVARAYRNCVERSGVSAPRTIGFHTLRHTAATQWIKAGADIHAVSRRLGHASAAFTMDTYGHLLKGMQRQAAEALDHLIG